MNQNQTKTEEFENLVTALKKWHTGTDGRDGATTDIWVVIPNIKNAKSVDWEDGLTEQVDHLIGSRYDLTPEADIGKLLCGDMDEVKRLDKWARDRALQIVNGCREIDADLERRHAEEGGVAKDDEAPCQKMKATIYTISTRDDTSDGFDFCVGGSYVTREAAVSALVEWMMERLTLRSDLAYAFAHDIDHEEMKDSVVFDRQKVYEEELKFTGKTEDEVRAYIRNEIDGEGCYYIYNKEWNENWHFDLSENDIEINGEVEKSALINGITPCKG